MNNPQFEIKHKDIGARIGLVEINKKRIETPLIMPVVSVKSQGIPASELYEKFKVQSVMTNAYIIWQNEDLRERVIEEGIHKFLNFDGVVATDSGSYQLMAYGNVLASNRQIVEFEDKIGTDIGSFLDVPSMPDAYKPRAEDQLEITLGRADETLSINPSFVVNGGIQGARYTDLRQRAAYEISQKFDLVAIGGIVKFMESYRFSELFDIIAAVKEQIPANKVVHAFGLGHPMVFPFAVAMGCDIFDSAAYALFAREGRYMTEYGTEKIDEIDYLPCCCPVCSKYDVTDIRSKSHEEKTRLISMHNLYVTFEEMNRVKTAIKEGSLWELIQARAHVHPALFAGFKAMLKHSGYYSELDPITKKTAFFYTGAESGKRTEILNAQKRLKRVSGSSELKDIIPFGSVPCEISELYPFGSMIHPSLYSEEQYYPGFYDKYNLTDIEIFKKIMDYQFGEGAGDLVDEFKKIRIKRSRKTKRMRWVYSGKELIASIRASDHFIIPKEPVVKKIHEKFKYPLNRVVIEDDAVPFVREGKSVFAKFVTGIDPDLRAGDEVIVVDKNDALVGSGNLLLAPKEAMDFKRGAAVNTR